MLKGANKDNLANKCLKYDYNLKGPSRAMSDGRQVCS
jgi:hypothetical protein